MTKNIILSIWIIILGQSSICAQSLYDQTSITEIKMYFSQTDWDAQLDALYLIDSGDRVIADSVIINGIRFDSVGVRYKGNSSYSETNAKNPFNVKLDYIKGKQDYDGHVTLKLNNGFRDPSFLRDILSYEIARKYMDVPEANFTNVYINGSFHGVYANVEAIDEKFLLEHCYSSSNPFFKCNPQYGGGNWSDLVYYGDDSLSYYDKYEIKTTYGWADLIMLCKMIEQNPESIEQYLDVDRAIWLLAFNNALVSLDSYVGGFKQNYYAYKDQNDRFDLIVWDQNLSFGCMGNTGIGNLGTTADKSMLSPFIHDSDPLWPLIVLVMSNDTYKNQYVAHMRTIMAENFTNNLYETRALALQAIIGASIQIDVNGFYNYSDFQNNVYNDISSGGPGGALPGIVALMSARVSYLAGLTEFQATPPSISGIGNSPV